MSETAAHITLADLAHRPMWVGWKEEIRNGKKTKLPYDPATGELAKSDNPKSWTTLGEAESWAIATGGNVGLMFAQLDGNQHTGGIDLDTCRDPRMGEIEPWAQEVIDRFQTYTEVSPSPEPASNCFSPMRWPICRRSIDFSMADMADPSKTVAAITLPESKFTLASGISP